MHISMGQCTEEGLGVNLPVGGGVVGLPDGFGVGVRDGCNDAASPFMICCPRRKKL